MKTKQKTPQLSVVNLPSPVVLNQEQFLPYQECVTMCSDAFYFQSWGLGDTCVSQGEGCCCIIFRAQQSLTDKHIFGPKCHWWQD